MSDAQQGGVVVPPLNDQQATAILQEALNRGMMQGAIPADEPTRLGYAQQLVSQAKLAAENGNQDENVMAVLFIAEADQAPPPVQPGVPVAAPAAVPPPGAQPVAAQPPVGAPPVQAPAAQGSFDVTTIGDDSLAKMIKTLEGDEYAGNADVQNELGQLRAEQARRQGGTPPNAQAAPPQAVAPPAQAPPAAAPPVAPVAAATAPAPPPGALGAPVAGQPQPPAGGAPGPIGFPPPPGAPADAGAVAAGQAQAPNGEGPVPQEQPSEEDVERTALEGQITMAMLRAHNIDASAVPSLSLDTVRMIVANPGGPVATETTTTPDAAAQQPSDQRENLLAQITGPILKAWGQGRQSLADIGDHELMLMIEHPQADVTLEQIQVVRGADGTTEKVTQLPPAIKAAMQPAQPAVPSAQPAPPAAPVPTPVQAAASLMQPPAPSAFAPVPDAAAAPAQPAPPAPAPVPVAAPPQPTQAAPEQPATPMPAQPPAPAPQQPVQPLSPPPGAMAMPSGTAQEKAMSIITSENMPIPPEIDGDPPRLPNDISKTSDGELQSYHARFHACEVRMNWVISQFDDEIGDVKKLLRNRRREVGLTIGATHEGKKVTKDVREALIEADEQVQQYVERLDEIETTVGKLKVLRDGYHQDVSTCSRQWSMRSGEQEKLPR